MIGLIEARLARDPGDAENRLYKGALLARLSLGMSDTDQAGRFLAAGVEAMRAAQRVAPDSSLACLRMLYARATTQVLLPRPPMIGQKVEKCLADLMSHPRFGQLVQRRRAVVLAMQAHLTDGDCLPAGGSDGSPLAAPWARPLPQIMR